MLSEKPKLCCYIFLSANVKLAAFCSGKYHLQSADPRRMRVGEKSRYCFANRTQEQSSGLLLAVLEAGKRGAVRKSRDFF